MSEPTRVPRRRKRTDPEIRFWRHVDKNGPVPSHAPELGPCWLWMSGKMNSGYGTFGTGGREGKNVGAHRWSYEHFVKPIPEGYEVDHICHPDDGSCPGGESDHHRRCVNPAHLKAVTGPENNLRSTSATALNARKTHCPAGHEYTPENTRIRNLPNGRKGRDCKECARGVSREEKFVPELARRNAAKTHCPHGHEYTPENTFFDKSSSGRRCRICLRVKSARSNEARRRAKLDKVA